MVQREVGCLLSPGFTRTSQDLFACVLEGTGKETGGRRLAHCARKTKIDVYMKCSVLLRQGKSCNKDCVS